MENSQDNSSTGWEKANLNQSLASDGPVSQSEGSDSADLNDADNKDQSTPNVNADSVKGMDNENGRASQKDGVNQSSIGQWNEHMQIDEEGNEVKPGDQ
jgi:hypothetical protein